MNKKNVFLITITVIISIGLFCSQSQARRVKNPQLVLLEKLAACIPATVFSIDEAAYPGFLEDKWDVLEGGIRVNFGNSAFFEVRRTESEIVIQVFGQPSVREWEIFEYLRKELDDISLARYGIPATSFHFYEFDVSNESAEAYSILNISEEFFEIIANDMAMGGSGSGIVVTSGYNTDADMVAVLDFVGEIKEAIDFAVSYGLIQVGWLNLDKKGLQSILKDASRLVPVLISDIESRQSAFAGPANLKNHIYRELNMLRFQLMRASSVLDEPAGDLVYRILHREYIKPLMKSATER